MNLPFYIQIWTGTLNYSSLNQPLIKPIKPIIMGTNKIKGKTALERASE